MNGFNSSQLLIDVEPDALSQELVPIDPSQPG